MGPRPSALLGLVLCLGQMIQTQDGRPPKPSLRAETGPVILRGQPVTFVCQGPAGARLFRLNKDGREAVSDQRSAPQDGRQMTEARFLIPEVNEHTAGSYRCLYLQGSLWSQLSDSVQLQVTEEDVSTPPPGRLPKPSLRAEPGTVILRGQPVTFVCQGPAGATIFRLDKEGRQVVSDQRSASQDGRQLTEARLLIPEVNERTAGSYRCLYKQEPNNWSERSDPVQLQVTEEDVSTPPPGSLWSEQSDPVQLQETEEDVSTLPPGPASRNYKVENSIRLGLAGAVLLILVAILVEAGLSQRRAPQGPQE